MALPVLAGGEAVALFEAPREVAQIADADLIHYFLDAEESSDQQFGGALQLQAFLVLARRLPGLRAEPVTQPPGRKIHVPRHLGERIARLRGVVDQRDHSLHFEIQSGWRNCGRSVSRLATFRRNPVGQRIICFALLCLGEVKMGCS